MNNNTKLHFSRQSGLSLIELMISMVVGLFLLAGVVTNFMGTKTADVKRQAVSEMDANAAAAFQVLRQVIAHAGYASIANVRIDKPFYTAIDGTLTNPSTCGNGSSRDVLTPTSNRITRDSDGQDFLSVINLADNPCKGALDSCPDVADVNPNARVYTDCTGGGTSRDARTVSCSTDLDKGMDDPTEAKIYNSFSLVKDPDSDDDRGFFCDGSRGGREMIVDNVEAVQYLYGVRQDNGNTIYRTADEVEAAGQWGMVNSVQVGLLMRSPSQLVLDVASTKNTYKLLGGNVDIATTDLRRLFRIYTNTINLENKNKGALL